MSRANATCRRRRVRDRRVNNRRQLNVSFRRQDREQVIQLKHKPNMPRAPCRQSPVRHSHQSVRLRRGPSRGSACPVRPANSTGWSCPIQMAPSRPQTHRARHRAEVRGGYARLRSHAGRASRRRGRPPTVPGRVRFSSSASSRLEPMQGCVCLACRVQLNQSLRTRTRRPGSRSAGACTTTASPASNPLSTRTGFVSGARTVTGRRSNIPSRTTHTQ
jgi:hypothetical protein